MVGDVVWFMPRILAGPMAPRLRPQQRCIRSCIDCAARHSPLRCQHPIRVPSLKTAISDVFDQHQLIPIPILDIRVRIILSLRTLGRRPALLTKSRKSTRKEQAAAAARTRGSGARCTQSSHHADSPHREARLVRLQRCHTTCGVDGPLIHGYGLGMFWLRHAAAAASADDRHVSWLRGRRTIAVGGTRCKHASVFQRARACAR